MKPNTNADKRREPTQKLLHLFENKVLLKNTAAIGEPAPLFSVSDWVQGQATNLDQLLGRVVLLEVFQVNCPGCFLYALPQAIELYQRYHEQGLSVIGIATAFEDFDKNTLANLQALVANNEVIGETYHALSQHGMLDEDNKLPYRMPFPLAMDRLEIRDHSKASDREIVDFITEHVPDFAQQPQAAQERIFQQVQQYFAKLSYRAQTFASYKLKGTPSYVLIDKKGILRASEFGDHSRLEAQIQRLLQEKP